MGACAASPSALRAPNPRRSQAVCPRCDARDWLRNAQRFPVLIDFENPDEATQLGARVGSQVSVLVYTGEHPILNAFGRFLSWLSGIMSYAY